MLKIQRILCPVDFSDASAKPYDYAYSLALRYEAKLYVQHVIPVLEAAYPYCKFSDTAANSVYWDLSKNAEERVQQIVQHGTAGGVQAEMIVHKGFAAESILSFAENSRADLIVMGTHGRRGLDRLVIGSVTEYVLRRAVCPVLAVRRPSHDFINSDQVEAPVRLRRVLFGTDFSDCAGTALDYALSLAQEYNAQLTLLHIIERLPEDTSPLLVVVDEAHRMLEELVPEEEQRDWCTVKATVRIGKPYEEIIQTAVERQIDVVVLGVRGRSAVDLAVFGSTTYRVLQLGPCPVLAVPEPRCSRPMGSRRSKSGPIEAVS